MSLRENPSHPSLEAIKSFSDWLEKHGVKEYMRTPPYHIGTKLHSCPALGSTYSAEIRFVTPWHEQFDKERAALGNILQIGNGVSGVVQFKLDSGEIFKGHIDSDTFDEIVSSFQAQGEELYKLQYDPKTRQHNPNLPREN